MRKIQNKNKNIAKEKRVHFTSLRTIHHTRTTVQLLIFNRTFCCNAVYIQKKNWIRQINRGTILQKSGTFLNVFIFLKFYLKHQQRCTKVFFFFFFSTVHLSVEDLFTFCFSNDKNTDSSQLYNLVEWVQLFSGSTNYGATGVFLFHKQGSFKRNNTWHFAQPMVGMQINALCI